MLMGYCNRVYRRGVEAFVTQARDAGPRASSFRSSLCLHDRDFRSVLEANGLTMSFLVSPTSTESMDEALKRAQRLSTVWPCRLTAMPSPWTEGDSSRASCTGNAVQFGGFGISDPADIQQLEGFVDGAIIGSAFVRALGPMGKAAF